VGAELHTVKFNPESGHWYDPQGRVVDGVPNAKGDKLIKPDIRHARKFGLVPSVTGITGQLSKPGLDNWKLGQLLLASLTLPRIENEPLDYFAARVQKDWQEQAQAAADAGTRIHAALNRWFCERLWPDDRVEREACRAVTAWLSKQDIATQTEVRGEVGFTVPGEYGGTADLVVDPVDSPPVIADFKTVEDVRLTGYKAYPENGYQLAGYARGLGYPPGTARHVNIAVGRSTGMIAVYEWSQDDIALNHEAFDLLLRLWQIRNRWQTPAQTQEAR